MNMKKTALILGIAALAFSCAQEEINHPVETGAPKAEAYAPVITVNDETNEVSFALESGTKAVIPVWEFQDRDGNFTVYCAKDGLKRIYPTAGTYAVRLQILNANGISPDHVERSFTIRNSIVNFDRYLTFLAGGIGEGVSRVWRVKKEVAGHLACGPSGTTGTAWWSAPVNDKEAFGLYNDRVTFSSDYSYTYDPGEDGMTYVNKDGVTMTPYVNYKGDGAADYNVPTQKKTTSYRFEVDGDDLYLVLAPGSEFPYIPNDEFLKNPRIRIESANAKTLELVLDNGSIAWHVTLSSEEEQHEEVFKGFNYMHDANLWRPVDAEGAHTYSCYYAPGWGQIDDPEISLEGGAYTLKLPAATTDQWQAQFFIIPAADLPLSAALRYDFSCIISSSTDHPGVTLKLTDVSDDGNFLFTKRVPVKAYEDHVFYLSDLPGIDAAAVKMVFDFGGNAGDTEITVSRITLKDHAVDDGTVLPGEPEEKAHYDIEGPGNLWRSATIEEIFEYYAPGWVQIENPVVTIDNYTYRFTLPVATTDQWQAQVAFRTDLSSSADKFYDFCCTVNASNDLKGVTIKLVLTSDNNTFYFTDRHDVAAGEDFVYKVPNFEGKDMDKISLFFDFGGNPANTDILVKDICFQEHREPQGGSGTGFDYASDRNLWKAADAAHTCSQYYAPGWTPLPNPGITNTGSEYAFTLPAATTERWQAQFSIIPDEVIALSAAKTYDFQAKVTSSNDIDGVTLKLTDTASDGNFLFEEHVDVKAYEECVFTLTARSGIDAAAVKMVFDFGGNPAGTEITIKDIILQEHE